MIVSFLHTHGGKHFIIFDGLPFMKRDTSDWLQANRNWEERNFIEFTYKLKLISELVI